LFFEVGQLVCRYVEAKADLQLLMMDDNAIRCGGGMLGARTIGGVKGCDAADGEKLGKRKSRKVGGCTSGTQFTHSSKAPGLN
jgi:hypothetical protein